MTEERTHDLVLFGATGFTGGLIAHYLRKRLGSSRRWAIAGRDRAKLESRRAELGGEIEVIEADSADPESLRAMVRQTKVVITTVGPYTRYGEPLVAACVDEGTDYVDLTGETSWWSEMVERYHERAAARDVLIIPACGFDCIPADMGALFTAAQLPDDQPMTIDAYARGSGSFSGGTVASAMEIVASGDASATPDRGKSRDKPPLIHYAREVDTWAVRSLVLDPWVVRRSAELRPEQFGDQLRYRQYFAFPSRVAAYAAVGVGGAVLSAAKLAPVRKLITKLRPSGSGPTPEQREKGWFRFEFVGRGGGREVKAHVSGGDPGYGETSKMISEAAIMLLEARDELPLRGGVVTTASGLGKGFIPRLEAVGIEFAVDH